jgi:hypothetical protein
MHFVELDAATFESLEVRRKTFAALDAHLDGFFVAFDALFESHVAGIHAIGMRDDRGLVTYLRSFSFSRSASGLVTTRSKEGVVSVDHVGDMGIQAAVADVFSDYRCVGIHDILAARSEEFLELTGGRYPIDMLLLSDDDWFGTAMEVVMNSRFVILYLDQLLGGVALELRLLRDLEYQDRTLICYDMPKLKDHNFLESLVGLFDRSGPGSEVLASGGRSGVFRHPSEMEALDDFPFRFPFQGLELAGHTMTDALSLFKTEVVDKIGPSEFYSPLGVRVSDQALGLALLRQLPQQARQDLWSAIEPLRLDQVHAVQKQDLLSSLQHTQRLVTPLFLCGQFDMLASCFALLHVIATRLGVEALAQRSLERAERARQWAGDRLTSSIETNVHGLVESWSGMLT